MLIMMAKDKMNNKNNSLSIENSAIAVIGSGYWGKNLVRNFYHLGNLKLICDKEESLLEQFKDQYSGIDTCLALNDVLSRKDIHGLVIATPAESHYLMVKEALLAGKHVFVEKPMALHQEGGEELISIAKQSNLVLMVGHLLQYHPVFVRLKELATSGELGRINYIYSNRLNLGKIRREENILWSFAPHDISMILSLAGEEPEYIQATGGNYLHKKIADVTTTHMEFPSGLQAHIFVSWLHPFKEQKLVVVGDRKMAVFDDTQPWVNKLLLYPHVIKWENSVPVPEKAEPERSDIPEDEPLRLECKHFIACISNEQQPLTDGDEGLRVLKVLNASQSSLNENGRKITLQSSSSAFKEAINKSFSPAHDTLSKDRDHFFADKTAVIDDGVIIDSGSKIWHFSHILPGCRIGEKCNIGQNVVIGPDVEVGKGCKIQNNVSVYKGVTLEDYVFCGPSVVFTNVYNPRANIRKMDEVRPTLVKTGATLGANCTIICGVNIGKYAFVGAGALVNKNVPDYALVVGNPARIIGWVCQCGERLSENLECLSCNTRYNRTRDGIIEVIDAKLNS